MINEARLSDEPGLRSVQSIPACIHKFKCMPWVRTIASTRAFMCVHWASFACVCASWRINVTEAPQPKPGAACLCKHESKVIEASSHSLFVSVQNIKSKLMVQQQWTMETTCNECSDGNKGRKDKHCYSQLLFTMMLPFLKARLYLNTCVFVYVCVLRVGTFLHILSISLLQCCSLIVVCEHLFPYIPF